MFFFNRINSLFLVKYKKLFLKCPKEKAVSKEEIEMFVRFFRTIFLSFSPDQFNFAKHCGVDGALFFQKKMILPKRFVQPDS